ncbi:DNA translocase FtsK [Wenzhouxiangella sp. XN24]|uniref:DNA translocase FtsK n=1 Tax=Wenzhouxiangella sp. XN24 TaxID=2713569 RepID=UPI0013EDA9E0|nr:DNA translocase FtsK [Wenzhouxiangella sp. XN24]NGX16683.1 cell division protein FtsK [Wenzhouxiangella sp. XN24]
MAKASESKPRITGLPVGRAVREGVLWIGWALALILLWALASYDPGDAGFASTGAGGDVNNAAGPVGAWISSFLYVLFGHAAYLFPVLLAATGWLALRTRTENAAPPGRVFGLRIAGFFVMLATSCGLASLHFAGQGLPETAGGIVGQLTGFGLQSVLSFLGATLLLLALWLAGVSLFLGVSWLAVMDRVGRLTLAAVGTVQRAVETVRDGIAGRKAAQARQESVERRKQSVVRKAPPRIEPVIPPVERSERVEKERQAPLFGTPTPGEIPPLGLLDDAAPKVGGYSDDALEAMSRLVELKLRDFGVEVEVVAVHPGPVVTRFELSPAPGVKVSQISNLAKDLARALSAIAVRVVEVIPGKPTVGLEIPNESRELVTLGEILASRAYDEMKSPLALALGKDIGGLPIVADLARMPHLLIAGTTGSGKSVAINAMVLSLLYKAPPDQVRVIMVDPKMLELSVYEGIPHLLAPVVTDMKEAANALRWCVAEMERRYRLMAALGVRNIGGFNRKLKEAEQRGERLRDPFFKPEEHIEGAEAPFLEPLPYIVVVVDELADMMMVVGKKVEELIARLAQKARASGIHLILATQRPSVDVITGLIKANIPSRIAFQVSAKVDSRTILDQMGAESLLGHGDMLFLPPGTGVPQRVHGAFVSDAEVHRVVKHLKAAGAPVYLDEVLEGPSQPIPGLSAQAGGGGGEDGEEDALYDEAVRIVTETRKASISGVQRRLKIGYNRAARLVETMEEAGLVGPLQSNGSREVLAPPPPRD